MFMSTTFDCQLSIKPRKNWFAPSDALIPGWKDFACNFQPNSQGHQELQKNIHFNCKCYFQTILISCLANHFLLLLAMLTEVDRNFLQNIISRK